MNLIETVNHSNDETLKECKHLMPMFNNDSEINESAMRSHNEVSISYSTGLITAIVHLVERGTLGLKQGTAFELPATDRHSGSA